MPNNSGTINKQVVNGMQLLPLEDQAFCLALHYKYTVVYRNLLAMASHSADICSRLPDSDKPDYNQPFYFFNNFMRDAASSGYRMIKGLNKDFHDRVMGYFRDKYRYNFASLELAENISFIGTGKLHAIAANIIAQQGTGLKELGKYLLRHEIRFAIRENKCNLTLRGTTIIFSRFMECVKRHNENSYLLYDWQRLTVLLRLLSIFHGGPFVLAKDEIALVDSLHALNKVSFDKRYKAFDRYCLRFYRNARFDLTFPDTESATAFMEMLKAENYTPPVPTF